MTTSPSEAPPSPPSPPSPEAPVPPAPTPSAAPKRIPRLEDFPPGGPNALATFSSRGWARVIDAFITDIPIFVLQSLIIAPTLTSDFERTPATEELTLAIAPWLVAGWAIAAVLYETLAIGWRGQTVGKWVLGLRVARFTDGKRPHWAQAVLRCLLPVCAGALTFQLTAVPALGAFAVFASAYFNVLRRGWHDDAGGTIVVRTR